LRNLRIGLSVLDVTGTHLNWSTGFAESKLPSVRLWWLSRDTLSTKNCFSVNCRFGKCVLKVLPTMLLFSFDPVTIDPHLGVEFSL
jgi:hypothetical protein